MGIASKTYWRQTTNTKCGDLTLDINANFPVNMLGYGIAGLNVLKALNDSGHILALFPIGNIEAAPEYHGLLQTTLKRQESYNSKAPCIRLYHQFALAETVGRGPRIGFPIFELDQLTAREQHHMNSVDHLFVCSEYAKRVVENNHITTPTSIIPLGVDRDIFHENVEYNPNFLSDDPTHPIHEAIRTSTIFLHIGKWEVRKGADVIVEAFNKAFTENDNVCLLLCCHNPFIGQANEEWERLYLSSPLGKKIFIVPRLPTQYDVAKLMQLSDCGLFPARAEGWNLELLEMMSMGKEVICTYFSAHTEFVNETNARLIYVDETELAFDGVWFHGHGRWAALNESQIDQMVAHMREVHEENERGPHTPAIEAAKLFSWKNTAQKIVAAIQNVK